MTRVQEEDEKVSGRESVMVIMEGVGVGALTNNCILEYSPARDVLLRCKLS